MPIELICLDADDTLWHNMRHFNATEHALFAMLKPFADIDVSREALIACEARNLPLYGYGVKGFTLSMIETAVELAGDRLTTSLIADILAAGRELLGHPVGEIGRYAEIGQGKVGYTRNRLEHREGAGDDQIDRLGGRSRFVERLAARYA